MNDPEALQDDQGQFGVKDLTAYMIVLSKPGDHGTCGNFPFTGLSESTKKVKISAEWGNFVSVRLCVIQHLSVSLAG